MILASPQGADLCLLLSALSFGFAFVGQRAAMIGGMGPMTFNACRYVLSGIVLLTVTPLLPPRHKVKTEADNIADSIKTDGTLVGSPSREKEISKPDSGSPVNETHLLWVYGLTLALLNFIASSAQQVGLQYTTAGKCAFITGFDVVFVPILGVVLPTFFGQDGPVKIQTWLAVAGSLTGLYLLSSTGISDFTFGKGEMFCLVGTVFWTFHIMMTDTATNQIDAISLTTVQFIGTGTLCTLASFTLEYKEWNIQHLMVSWQAILLLGVCECLGFTLQAMGQTHASPSRTVIIMSFEAVFTAVIGYIFLHEILTQREFIGCVIMLISFLSLRVDSCHEVVTKNSLKVLSKLGFLVDRV